VLALETSVGDPTAAMEGEDLREPAGEGHEDGTELGDLGLGPRMHEGLDARRGLLLGARVVDLVELLQQAPRMPQFRILAQRERKPGELLRAEVVGTRQLQVASAKDYRREGGGLDPARRCAALAS
jgi:hypothetical protein